MISQCGRGVYNSGERRGEGGNDGEEKRRRCFLVSPHSQASTVAQGAPSLPNNKTDTHTHTNTLSRPPPRHSLGHAARNPPRPPHRRLHRFVHHPPHRPPPPPHRLAGQPGPRERGGRHDAGAVAGAGAGGRGGGGQRDAALCESPPVGRGACGPAGRPIHQQHLCSPRQVGVGGEGGEGAGWWFGGGGGRDGACGRGAGAIARHQHNQGACCNACCNA